MNFIDPCLQHIPRDFDISIEGFNENGQLNLEAKSSSGEEFLDEESCFFLDKINENSANKTQNTISIRSAFIPSNDRVLLSADYCQLELRIITNLCKDETLIKIFNDKDNDVFNLLASKWLNVPITEIDEEKRQNVKKVSV